MRIDDYDNNKKRARKKNPSKRREKSRLKKPATHYTFRLNHFMYNRSRTHFFNTQSQSVSTSEWMSAPTKPIHTHTLSTVAHSTIKVSAILTRPLDGRRCRRRRSLLGFFRLSTSCALSLCAIAHFEALKNFYELLFCSLSSSSSSHAFICWFFIWKINEKSEEDTTSIR